MWEVHPRDRSRRRRNCISNRLQDARLAAAAAPISSLAVPAAVSSVCSSSECPIYEEAGSGGGGRWGTQIRRGLRTRQIRNVGFPGGHWSGRRRWAPASADLWTAATEKLFASPRHCRPPRSRCKSYEFQADREDTPSPSLNSHGLYGDSSDLSRSTEYSLSHVCIYKAWLEDFLN